MIAKDRDFTTADLHWSSWPAGEKPYQWINPAPEGTPKTNLSVEVRKAEITDIRGKEGFTLDKTGFEALYNEPTSLKYEDFDDESKVTSTYYKEVEEILKKATGAHRVVLFDHTIRRHHPDDTPDTPQTRRPVSRTHVDQTPKSGIERVHRHLGDEAEELLKGRVRLINVRRG